jgi:hypothetical protein
MLLDPLLEDGVTGAHLGPNAAVKCIVGGADIVVTPLGRCQRISRTTYEGHLRTILTRPVAMCQQLTC